MLKSGALSGSSGRFNGDQMDLVEALEVLRERSPQYVNAIRERYVAGVVPKEKSDEDALRRGLTALTAEMNQAHHRNHMQRDDGPGTRKAVSRSKAHWISKGNYDDDSPEAVQRLQVQARVSGL
jgi:hypothetical protein